MGPGGEIEVGADDAVVQALVKRRAAFGAEHAHEDLVAAEFERIDLHERQSTIVNHQGVKRPNVRFPACAKRLEGDVGTGNMRYDEELKYRTTVRHGRYERCSFKHCVRQACPGTGFCRAHGGRPRVEKYGGT